MIRRACLVLMAVAFVCSACSGSKSDDATSTSTSPRTSSVDTSAPGTSSTSSSTASTSSTTSEQEPVPPVTPPAGQEAACALLSDSALVAVGVPAGTAGTSSEDPNGEPAPSKGCSWTTSEIAVLLFYGKDPVEILAVARQDNPGGTDITGLGQDAFYSPAGVLFVDTGSQAFEVGGALTQAQLKTLAENVLVNL